MYDIKSKQIFSENSINFDNIPVKESVFQNTSNTPRPEEQHQTINFKSTVELYSEFFQRAELYQKSNIYANLLSKDLSQPIIKKEYFLKSTGLTDKELIKSNFFFTVDENFLLLDYNVLKDIILSVGSYSQSVRFTVWKYLLSLHGNDKLYKTYFKKGTHKFFENLDNLIPVKDKVLRSRLKSSCSIIAHWSPQIGIAHFLPNVAFPFIKCIKGDEPFLIDVLVSIFTYWCQYWFDLYPEQPVNHLKVVEIIISKENPTLLSHLTKIKCITSICWEFMRNLYAENLEKEKWMQLIDFLLTFNHRPEYLIYFHAAFLLSQEVALKNCKNISDIEKFQYSILNVDMLKLFNQTVNFEKKYSSQNNNLYKPYVPLQETIYPVVHFSQLLEFLKTVSNIREVLSSDDKERKNKKVSKKIKHKEFQVLKPNEQKTSGRYQAVNEIRSNINKSQKSINKEKEAVHKIENSIKKKEFQQKLNSVDMSNEEFTESNSKFRKEIKSIEADKSNHLARIKELEFKIDELQKNVIYYKQLSEPYLDDKNSIQKETVDDIDDDMDRPIRSKNFHNQIDIKNSLHNSEYNQSLVENDQMRSYNLSNSANSYKNGKFRLNKGKFDAESSLENKGKIINEKGKIVKNYQNNQDNYNQKNQTDYNNLL